MAANTAKKPAAKKPTTTKKPAAKKPTPKPKPKAEVIREQSLQDVQLTNEVAKEAQMDAKEQKRFAIKAKQEADNRYMKHYTRDFLESLKHEKTVQIYGDPLYIPYLGETYTYLLNGTPVIIKFDETWQEFPESVAKNLQKKLKEISRSNVSRKIDVQI